uniref:BHLH domain-containing protein n=1 Tax=Steinernema glaseri TaxID=37863 RepID=A0A1I8AJT9_9BILA
MSVGRRRVRSLPSTRKSSPAHHKIKNERERRRIRQVNEAFDKLRARVPSYRESAKRVSKLRILEGAIQYIRNLCSQLDPSKEAKTIKKTKGYK